MSSAQDILSMELMSEPIASDCASDVFGGVSYNKVSGGWGHSTEYRQERSREAIGKEASAAITACSTSSILSANAFGLLTSCFVSGLLSYLLAFAQEKNLKNLKKPLTIERAFNYNEAIS